MLVVPRTQLQLDPDSVSEGSTVAIWWAASVLDQQLGNVGLTRPFVNFFSRPSNGVWDSERDPAGEADRSRTISHVDVSHWSMMMSKNIQLTFTILLEQFLRRSIERDD